MVLNLNKYKPNIKKYFYSLTKFEPLFMPLQCLQCCVILGSDTNIPHICQVEHFNHNFLRKGLISSLKMLYFCIKTTSWWACVLKFTFQQRMSSFYKLVTVKEFSLTSQKFSASLQL